MKIVFKLVFIFTASLILIGSVCQREHPGAKEARGLWVTRWEWAVGSDSNRVEAQKQRITHIFDMAKKAKFNFILFQIRGNGDAFYPSALEPWSDLLTGTFGADPGWDPLQYALSEAHLRGLELHVWFNVFPAWRGAAPPPHTTPDQVYNAHPEWIVCDKNGRPMPLNSHYVNLSPGIPAARDFIHRVAMDIVTRYDIDGFHFDYIRYPEGSNSLGYSQDSVSLRLFNSPDGNPQQLNWENWQRENINIFVRKFYDEATHLKSWLKISAAVIGKYDYSSWNGFHIVYQDARRWVAEGKIDFIIPMIYWQMNHPTAPFGSIVKNWFDAPHERYIFPGISVNKLGAADWPLEEAARQVAFTLENGGNGVVFFSFSGLKKAMNQFDHRGFHYLSNLPAMSWKDDKPPLDPRNVRSTFTSAGKLLLIWSPPDSLVEPTDVRRYNIYRSLQTPVDISDARNLIQITAAADTFFLDAQIEPGRNYYYVVTALDRVNNESPPSNEIRVATPHFVFTRRAKEVTMD